MANEIQVTSHEPPLYDPEVDPNDWDQIPFADEGFRALLKPVISPREYGRLYLTAFDPLFEARKLPLLMMPTFEIRDRCFAIMTDDDKKLFFKGALSSLKNLCEKEKLIQHDRTTGDLVYRRRVETSLFLSFVSRKPEAFGYIAYHSTVVSTDEAPWRITLFIHEKTALPGLLIYRPEHHTTAVEFMCRHAALRRFERACACCGRCVDRGLPSRCAGCKERYCGEECQRKHWGVHKRSCGGRDGL